MTPAATKTTTTATPESGRRLWSATEDEILTKTVAEHGAKDWEKVAATVGTRKDWQCRERWHNHLKPGVCKKPWTAWEDQLLEAQVRELGTSWATIAQTFPGRPTTSVKNRWHQLQRKNNRRQNSPSTVASPFTSPLSERASFGAGAGASPSASGPLAPLDTYWPILDLSRPAMSAALAVQQVPQVAPLAKMALAPAPQQLPDLLASYSAVLAAAAAPVQASPAHAHVLAAAELPALAPLWAPAGTGPTAPTDADTLQMPFLLHADPADHNLPQPPSDPELDLFDFGDDAYLQMDVSGLLDLVTDPVA
mmetsp:Transcript_26203/g.70810  ORF Transcript_26203/g.70810 Transcript_26203/m.70810 type:complete len:308 (+) Transcript_26203:125-1048(+)